jgi:hypothetical protein
MYKNGWKANNLYLAYSYVRIPVYMLEQFHKLIEGDHDTWDIVKKEARAQFLEPYDKKTVGKYLGILKDLLDTQHQGNELHRLVKREYDLITIVDLAQDPDSSTELLSKFINLKFRSKIEAGRIDIHTLMDFESFFGEAISLVPQENSCRPLLVDWETGVSLQVTAAFDNTSGLMTNQSKRSPPAD